MLNQWSDPEMEDHVEDLVVLNIGQSNNNLNASSSQKIIENEQSFIK
jgi:hypothetical protein